MQKYINSTRVPLSVAVYLATDTYDHIPGVISATGLMRPIRQVVLTPRVPPEEAVTDVLQVVKARMGTSIHDGLEKAWVDGHYRKSMKEMGYPQHVIDRVVVNPGYESDILTGQLVKMENPATLPKDAIPVYMEIRTVREIDGKQVSGKFDFSAEGRVEDFKSTSTFAWTHGNKDEDYKIQGSIYRWLNPEIITKDHIAIQFFFTDWKKGLAATDPKYPQRICEQKLIPLMSLADTEVYIRERLANFEKFRNAKEEDLPICTDKELWRKDPVFKYYANPAKMTRSTKNFTVMAEAQARLVKDKNKGVVLTVPGKVVACEYCAAFSICKQKDQYLADGSLTI